MTKTGLILLIAALAALSPALRGDLDKAGYWLAGVGFIALLYECTKLAPVLIKHSEFEPKSGDPRWYQKNLLRRRLSVSGTLIVICGTGSGLLSFMTDEVVLIRAGWHIILLNVIYWEMRSADAQEKDKVFSA